MARPSPLARRLLPLAVVAALGAGVAVEGGCIPISPGGSGATTPPPPTPDLAPRYVLALANGAPIPATISVTVDGTRLRVLADTLTFSPSGAGSASQATGTVSEVAVLGSTPPGGTEQVLRRTLAGVPWRRQTGNPEQIVVDTLVLLGARGLLLTASADAQGFAPGVTYRWIPR